VEDEEDRTDNNREGSELHGDKSHGQGWVQGDGDSSVAEEEDFKPKVSSQEAREDKAWMHKSETSEGRAAEGRPVPRALQDARHRQKFQLSPRSVKASKASPDTWSPRSATSAHKAGSENVAGAGRGALSKQDLEAKAAKLNAKYGVKVGKSPTAGWRAHHFGCSANSPPLWACLATRLVAWLASAWTLHAHCVRLHRDAVRACKQGL